MAGVKARSFDSPDETRSPEKTRVDVVDVNGQKAARLTAQPGWKWSECIKPVVGGDSCQAKHFGVVISGQMHIVHNDGSEADITPGSAYVIEPGHDAWVVGDETFVGYEFESPTAASFAKNVAEHAAATAGHIS
ncbi:cupin domain-containing protein [Smaragdicoccus niigatensis]|uniref:cupin domain-containing protein n=1 Tax=Smaragdicoccus niigatensis TaxID=359359 RepID=UPI0006872A0D|nr:cupin domain-containing protein [Smaragdicoccus niigatensis]